MEQKIRMVCPRCPIKNGHLEHGLLSFYVPTLDRGMLVTSCNFVASQALLYRCYLLL